MDIRQTPLILSVPLGRWFDVDVRLSVWFLALVFLFCVRLGFVLGCYVSLILFISILIHEFAHVFGARQTGGEGHEILMWPFGGLAFVSPAPGLFSEFWTVAAGPISNAILCLVCLPAVISTGLFWECLHPVVLPPVDVSTSDPKLLFNSIFLLFFSINFKLLILNLLPIYPLDGGQIAYSFAKLHWEKGQARLGTLFVGGLLAMILVFIGALMESTDFVLLSVLLMVFVIQAHMTAVIQQRSGDFGIDYGIDEGDEYSFTRYDEDDDQPRLNPLQRWKVRRMEKRMEREARQLAETSERVDELLEKINLSGFDSLSDAEKKFLQKASSKYRTQGD